jgi:DNA invertase Pin-like site-specific DNA recombinase
MLSVFAQFERQLIIEPVHSGMNHAKKHGTRIGKAIGRPETVAHRATYIRALAHEDRSMAAIARKLGSGTPRSSAPSQTIESAAPRALTAAEW